MKKYTVRLGMCGPTDCTLCINDKEYAVDSFAHKILGCFWDIHTQKMHLHAHKRRSQCILKYIYTDRDVDLFTS